MYGINLNLLCRFARDLYVQFILQYLERKLVIKSKDRRDSVNEVQCFKKRQCLKENFREYQCIFIEIDFSKFYRYCSFF